MSIKATASFSLADQLFNPESVEQLACAFDQAYAKFERKKFEHEVLKRFPALALKERIDWMVAVLEGYLPSDFFAALTVLERALPPPLDQNKTDNDFGEFIWVVPGEYVARHGCRAETLDASLRFLREATKRFSSESAIRPFLRSFPEPTIEFMRRCASDDNYHVRRFASEGSRPFLPWAQRVDLPLEQVISILHLLYADPTRYVTRSVANAMNDIAKIDAELAVRTLIRWRKLNQQTPDELGWMLRHATRGLMKQGHPLALKLLDYTVEPLVEISNLATTKQLFVGEAFNWQCNLVSRARQKLKITLHIHFLKANGNHAAKAFAVRDADFLKGEAVSINKRLSFKSITTRTLYPGQHFAELVINGVSCAKRCFDLRA